MYFHILLSSHTAGLANSNEAVMCAGPGLKGPGSIHLCPLGMSDRPVQSPEGSLAERSGGNRRKPRASTQTPDPPWELLRALGARASAGGPEAASPRLPSLGARPVHGQASEGGWAATAGEGGWVQGGRVQAPWREGPADARCPREVGVCGGRGKRSQSTCLSGEAAAGAGL